MTHPTNLATLGKTELDKRIRVMEAWPTDYADALDNDPRCGCDPECPFDHVDDLEAAWKVAR